MNQGLVDPCMNYTTNTDLALLLGFGGESKAKPFY